MKCRMEDCQSCIISNNAPYVCRETWEEVDEDTDCFEEEIE